MFIVINIDVCRLDSGQSHFVDATSWQVDLKTGFGTRVYLIGAHIWQRQGRVPVAATPDKDMRCILKVIRNVDLGLAMRRCWLWLESFDLHTQASQHALSLLRQVVFLKYNVRK